MSPRRAGPDAQSSSRVPSAASAVVRPERRHQDEGTEGDEDERPDIVEVDRGKVLAHEEPDADQYEDRADDDRPSATVVPVLGATCRPCRAALLACGESHGPPVR